MHNKYSDSTRGRGNFSRDNRRGGEGYNSQDNNSSSRRSFEGRDNSDRGYSNSGGNRGGQRNGGPRGGGRGGMRKARPIKQIDVASLISRIERQASAPAAAPHIIQHQFSDFKIAEELKENIANRGYVTPTPIQDLAIPEILKGKDVVGIASTGTGKSGAFLIPIIDKILSDKMQRALIVVPTRELASQVDDELRKLTGNLRIYSVICVGGLSIMPQRGKLRQMHNIVIGTPGRLKDLVDRGDLQLMRYSTIVLDEVDRMLDMGFVRDMQYLIDEMPDNRQSLFFSATMAPAVEKIMQQFVNEYTKVAAKSEHTSATINQIIVEVGKNEDKVEKLKEILDSEEVTKSIVFTRTKWSAQRLGDALFKMGYEADSIHGDKRQAQRQKIMQKFKAGALKVLVATDVAARGLDIKDLSHVINFDLPETADDYTHRIGRVGRAGKTGVAISMVQAR